MSRIGKMPIALPAGVKVEWQTPLLKVTANKNTLTREIHSLMDLLVDDKNIIVKPLEDSQNAGALWGLTRSLINNMVIGVTTGFSKVLEVSGVGWRVEQDGSDKLKLMLGFSHPVIYQLPKGVTAVIDDKANKVTINGIDKEMVGLAAAQIRSYRKPEPYKGKGIKYVGEYIQRKVGKAGAAAK